MQHFYDGQIRRYITQTIRVLSNFTVRYGDGTLVRVPVMYGDADRQAASIIRQNSENKISSVPRISVYISGLELDRNRLGDPSYVGKVHVREREINNSDPANPVYTTGQGRNYTVERLMPTPFKLSLKCDIWTANTEQKLQLLEQILVLFNPSLELQTTDNYIDWTSLTVLNLGQVNWSSRQVPVGTDTPIDIASLSFDTPIWISPPVKVKHLGVITKIITSLNQGGTIDKNTYIEGLGQPLAGPETTFGQMLSRDVVTITDYTIQVYNNQAILLQKSESSIPREPTLEIPVRQGTAIEWQTVFDKYPSKYTAGSSSLYLIQSNGTEVVGTVAISPLDPTVLTVSWDSDTLNTNTSIDSEGNLDTDPGYGAGAHYRSSSPGTFDAIVDPTTKGPRGSGLIDPYSGMRYLLVEDIGHVDNDDGADAWKGDDNSDLIANANDIVEWDGTKWIVIFDSVQEPDTLLYQTNIYTGVQYVWNGVFWAKSFEGEYKAGAWRLEL
jgi:hypothetical protein